MERKPHLVEVILGEIDAALIENPDLSKDDVMAIEDEAWAELVTDVNLGFITDEEALGMYTRFFNSHHRNV